MKAIRAKDIMTKRVLTVKPDTTVKALAQFLLKHHISGAPVVDRAGKLAGIVTEGDLIFRDANVHLPTVVTVFDAVIYLESPRKYEKELQKVIGKKVADIMSRDVLTIEPELELSAVATIMHERKRHLLPVVKAGKLVGIVGKADVVRAIAREE
ncbi:MAG: CBS domain-containing protein [candidate division FCPU426 bacterium]